MQPEDLIRYAALVKNMRCIIYKLNGEEVSIIKKYHRNRGVGVLESQEVPAGKCFVKVHVPEFISDIAELQNPIERVIFISSLYLAPIVTSKSHLNDFAKFSVKDIKSSNYNIREFLRHLRISEYSIIDFYLSKERGMLMDKFVNEDIKRFWRIMNEKGQIIGHYLFVNQEIFSIVLSMP